jgi:succinoglycan biosynthesis transport protein ExoP
MELTSSQDEPIKVVTDSDSNRGGSLNDDIQLLFAAARRQKWVLLICSILGLAAGIGYLKIKIPDYTATAVLFIDNQKARAVQDTYQSLIQRDIEVGNSFLDTQVELLGSEPIVFSVIDKLNLLKDPEFNQQGQDFFAGVLPAFLNFDASGSDSASASASKEDTSALHRRVAEVLKRHIEVHRVARTPILQITGTSQNSDKAAKIANGFVQAYLANELQGNYDATQQASTWLQDRISDLKNKVVASDLALQKFRAENDLISTGGRLVSEQQLAEVNSQLVIVRADIARASARYKQIKQLRDDHQPDALLTDAVANPFIEQLRQKYVALNKREAELKIKVGPGHAAVLALQQELREYEKLMFQELGKIEDMAKSELEAAQRREQSLSENLAQLVTATASNEKRLVTFRELQREADSYKSLYQTILQRNQELLQTHSFPISESRPVLAAWPPDAPSHPKALTVLAVALALGAGLGSCVGAAREYRDRALRTARQVQSELQLGLLGMLPHVAPRRRLVANGEGRLVRRLPPLMRYVVDHPLSEYAQALSTVKIAADATLPRQGCKKIGIVSVLPGEGKTTVAFNIGLLLAQVGMRTLLVDADLRNPQLTRRSIGEATGGILSAASNDAQLDDIVVRDEMLPLALFPAVIRKAIPHTWAVLQSSGVERALQQGEKEFDFILFDLPPMGPLVDVSAFAPRLDGIVFVVEWGSTPHKLVKTMLETNPRVREVCLGIILNKVDMKRLKYYESYDSKEYYHAQYLTYYRDRGAAS